MAEICFTTKPYEINGWTILRLPKEASEQLPSRGQVMVRGTVNGIDFQTPLEPDGTFGHWFRVEDGLRQKAGISLAATAAISISVTKLWPEPAMPDDWQDTLRNEADIAAYWKGLTPMARHEWLRWINSTANPATRKQRIQASCSKMRSGLRRPCCFNRSMSCVPEVSKNGRLLEPSVTA